MNFAFIAILGYVYIWQLNYNLTEIGELQPVRNKNADWFN